MTLDNLRKIYFFVTILVINTITPVSAQEKPKYTLEADYFYSSILAHRPSIKHLLTEHPEGVSMAINKHTYGDSRWQWAFNYPDYGLSATYHNLKNPVLGELFGIYAHLNFYLNKQRNLYFRIAQGIAYNTNPYDTQHNFRNTVYGSPVMPSTYFSLIYRKQNIFRNFGIQAGLSFHHFSNAKIKSPNTGTNNVVASVGLNYSFDNQEREFITHSKIKYTEPLAFNLVLRSGINSNIVIGTKQYPFYVLSTYIDKRISEKSSFELGSDLFVMYSEKEYLRYTHSSRPEVNYPQDTDFRKVGIFGGYQLHISKLAIQGQIGYYVYAPFNENDPIYQRLGLKYTLSKRFYTGISLKTHLAKADAVEFSVGCRF